MLLDEITVSTVMVLLFLHRCMYLGGSVVLVNPTIGQIQIIRLKNIR